MVGRLEVRPSIAVVLFAAACNPATTRPDFLPSPQAVTGTVDATRQQLVPEIATWLGAAGLAVTARSVLGPGAELDLA